MKNLFILTTLLFVISSCKHDKKLLKRKYIEPSEYSLMDYQVKDVSYHDSDSVKFYRQNASIVIMHDSIFKVSKDFGRFIFKGSKFYYKVLGDSIFLEDEFHNKSSYKVLDLTANFFSIELVNNKYFNRIGFIKPRGKRRKITREVNIEY